MGMGQNETRNRTAGASRFESLFPLTRVQIGYLFLTHTQKTRPGDGIRGSLQFPSEICNVKMRRRHVLSVAFELVAICICIMYHGCCWETFYIFAFCGLVGNPHLTAKQIQFLLPFQRQPRYAELGVKKSSLTVALWSIVQELGYRKFYRQIAYLGCFGAISCRFSCTQTL